MTAGLAVPADVCLSVVCGVCRVRLCLGRVLCLCVCVSVCLVVSVCPVVVVAVAAV